MHITLIEPFFTGSHQQWAEGLKKYTEHEVQILSLKGKYWKWRMFGGAVALARVFNEEIEKTDLILATDMLDFTTFLALTKEKSPKTPTAIYFHENQLTYPWSPSDKDVKLGRNNEYAFINYTSALVADKVFFNSQYHLNSFLDALPSFLKQFPDCKELQNVDKIRKKSELLYLGMDLKRFDKYEPNPLEKDIPVILWNHRWEYDKNPDDFFNVLYQLKEERIDFKLILLGEKYVKYPEVFDKGIKVLSNEILHCGYTDSFEDYARWLKVADILPITSNQDFFGGSIVEAMYCGVIPLLPNRLAYPEHIPKEYHQDLLYNNNEELYHQLKFIIQKSEMNYNPKNWVKKYDWQNIIKDYNFSFKY